jgi:hypothetical protein
MPLPVIVVVEDPAIVAYESGTEVRLAREQIFISDLWFSLWAMEVMEQPRDEDKPVLALLSKLRINRLILELALRRHRIRKIYLTPDAASELLPEMCRPLVPFALERYDAELVQACAAVLGESLDFAL